MQIDATLQLPDGKQIPVVARAIEVLGSKARTIAWLRTPLTGLNGRTPLQAIANAEGRQEVDDILGRIEHGVFG